MNKTSIFAFIFGATIGSAVTWYLMNKKCAALEEDNAMVRDFYSNREKKGEEDSAVITSAIDEKPELMEYAARLQENGYVNYSNPEEAKGSISLSKPYIISEAMVGERGYECACLTYYADNLLADEDDELVENIDSVIGFDALSSFGGHGDEEETDVVYVRNDERKMDYEITRDERKYMSCIRDD